MSERLDEEHIEELARRMANTPFAWRDQGTLCAHGAPLQEEYCPVRELIRLANRADAPHTGKGILVDSIKELLMQQDKADRRAAQRKKRFRARKRRLEGDRRPGRRG